MRLAFLGTPDFAVPTLAAILAAGHEVVCVYSQPPAPRGRGRQLAPSPVQAFAHSRGLEVRTPASLKTPEETAAFAALSLDAAVVVAFGQILSREILEVPRLGCFNLHRLAAAEMARARPRSSGRSATPVTRSPAWRSCAWTRASDTGPDLGAGHNPYRSARHRGGAL